MSADLHLIALPDDPAKLAMYAKLQASAFTCSDDDDLERDADGFVLFAGERGLTFDDYDRLNDECRRWDWPNIWIGQVSWMKAGLLDDMAWVPAAVLKVNDLYAGNPVLTPALATATMVALNLPNRSHYGHTTYWWHEGRYRRDRSRGLAKRQDVKKWLHAHLGQRITAESW